MQGINFLSENQKYNVGTLRCKDTKQATPKRHRIAYATESCAAPVRMAREARGEEGVGSVNLRITTPRELEEAARDARWQAARADHQALLEEGEAGPIERSEPSVPPDSDAEDAVEQAMRVELTEEVRTRALAEVRRRLAEEDNTDQQMELLERALRSLQPAMEMLAEVPFDTDAENVRMVTELHRRLRADDNTDQQMELLEQAMRVELMDRHQLNTEAERREFRRRLVAHMEAREDALRSPSPSERSA